MLVPEANIIKIYIYILCFLINNQLPFTVTTARENQFLAFDNFPARIFQNYLVRMILVQREYG